MYTRSVRGEHIGRILDLRELGPLRRPEIVVVGMPKKSQASNPSASPRVGLDSLLQFCPQVFHPSSPGLLVHDLLEETSPWDPASADRLPVLVCSTFPRCYTLEMRGLRGSDVVLRDGEPAVSDQRNTFSIKCVSQPSPKNLGGLTTVAPVLFGKPFDGIVAVLTILRGDIGEVTLRVELLNFALFPKNAVVSFVLQPGPLIVVIVHFANSCIFRASPSTMGSRDTTYTTAAGKWRRCDFVEVVSVHDTAIASFPTRLSTWEALPSLAPSVFSSKVCGSNVKFVVLFTVMHALQGRTATSYSPEDRSILVQLLLLPAWTVPQDPLHLKPRTVAPIRYLTDFKSLNQSAHCA